MALVILTFLTLVEMALVSVGQWRVRRLLEGSLSDIPPSRILNDPFHALLAIKLLHGVAYVMAAAALTLWAIRQTWPLSAMVGALVGLGVLLAAIEIIARALVSRTGEAALRWTSPLLGGAYWLFLPLTWPLRWLERRLQPSARVTWGEDVLQNEEGLRFLLQVGEEGDAIEEEEQEMIASIFEFSETLVREVMVPRIDIVALDVQTPFDEAVKVVLEAGHSRIPVYRENIDNIIGLLYAKDLLRYLAEGRNDVDLSKILRPAYFVPETKKVDELLQELQKRKIHMAIVVDEYGGTAGLATIEDLLEEIVGEIQDEYDTEEPFIEEVSDTAFIFNARVDLEEVNKRLQIKLPDEGGDTLGGFIYNQLGKIPAQGDTLSFDGVTIEILSVEGQRIERVLVRRDVPPGEDQHRESTAPALLTLSLFR
ncbi:MAG: hemolysin family protein [Anaerolineae bacterium]